MTEKQKTRVAANKPERETTEGEGSPVQVQWQITTTSDLNRLVDQITGTAGNVVNFMREVVSHFNDYHEIRSATIPNVPAGSTIKFAFTNADSSATLRYSGLMKTAQWNSQVNTHVKTSFAAGVPGKNVIVVEHSNDNGLWQFDLVASVNGARIVDVTVSGNDNAFPGRKRLFVFKFNVVQGAVEGEKRGGGAERVVSRLTEFAETARSEQGVLTIDGMEFKKGVKANLEAIDKDLSAQIKQRMEEASREAAFRRANLENPLTRPANTADYPIHYSVNIDTNTGWAEVDWHACKDKDCIEHKMPGEDDEPAPKAAHKAKKREQPEHGEQAGDPIMNGGNPKDGPYVPGADQGNPLYTLWKRDRNPNEMRSWRGYCEGWIIQKQANKHKAAVSQTLVAVNNDTDLKSKYPDDMIWFQDLLERATIIIG